MAESKGVRPMGVMALEGKALAKIVDDTVAALRIGNPPWIGWYGDSLPAKVQELILEGAAAAREQTTKGESTGLYATGGVWIEYDPIGQFTEIKVLIATVYDDLVDAGGSKSHD